jgi:hypothetical protein
MSISGIRSNGFDDNHEEDYKQIALLKEVLSKEDLPLDERRMYEGQLYDLQYKLNPKPPR